MKKEISTWDLFWTTFKINAVTFGGGYVIISYIMQQFVKEKEWLTEEEFFPLVPIAQSTPGPFAVNSSTLLGYYLAGNKGAFATAMGSILPPFIIMSIVSYLYLTIRDWPAIQYIMLGMQAGVAAIIVNVVIDLSKGIISSHDAVYIGILILASIATVFFETNIILVLLASALIGFAYSFVRPNGKKKEENE